MCTLNDRLRFELNQTLRHTVTHTRRTRGETEEAGEAGEAGEAAEAGEAEEAGEAGDVYETRVPLKQTLRH